MAPALQVMALLIRRTSEKATTVISKKAARRGFEAIMLTLGAGAIVLAGLHTIGYRPLVVQSGSMSPTLLTGDLILTHQVPPSSIRVGDVVTFSVSGRPGVLITHRVVQRDLRGQKYSFVTKGDSNAGVEEWAVNQEAKVGRLALRIPKLGLFLSGLSTPAAGSALVGLLLGLISSAAVRRIWL